MRDLMNTIIDLTFSAALATSALLVVVHSLPV